MIDRKTLKQNARAAMAETKPGPFWVTLAVAAILAVLAVLAMSLNGDLDMLRGAYEELVATGTVSGIEPGSISLFASALVLALELMSAVVSVGYVLYTLRVSRRQGPGFGDVMDAFGVFFRAVWLSLLQNLIVSMAMMVYLIPAMSLSLTGMPALSLLCLPLLAVPLRVRYSFRQAAFIMLDNPNLPCGQCMMLSGAAMRGHKWELFKLDLSFIGWYILSIVPFVGLYVKAYTAVTSAGYYDALVPAYMQSLSQTPPPPPPPSADYHVPGRRQDDDDER